MMFRWLILSLVLGFVACDRSSVPQSPVLLTWENGQFDQSDWEAELSTLAPKQAKQFKDSLKAAQLFYQILDKQLTAPLGKKYSSERDRFVFQVEAERNLSTWYQDYYIGQNLGFTTTTLLLHYERNKERFTQGLSPEDKAKHQDLFEHLRKEVAKDLAFNKYDFKGFYEKNKRRFRKNPTAELKWILLKDPKKATELQSQLQAGSISWEKALINSLDSISKAQNGSLGTVSPMDSRASLKPYLPQLRVNLFAKKSWTPGQYEVLNSSGSSAVFLMDSFTPEQIQTFEEAKEHVFRRYAPSVYQEIYKNTVDSLRLKFKVGTFQPDTSELESQAIEYYQANMNQFMTQPEYQLAYTTSKEQDSTQLKQLGWVKVSHALPQGLGLIKGLEQKLTPESRGWFPLALNTPKGVAHFYTYGYKAPQVKPFERVKAQVINELKNPSLEPVADSLVLAWSKDNRKLLVGKEFNYMLSNLNSKNKRTLKTKNLVDHLIALKLFAQEAQNHGYVLKGDVQSKMNSFELNYWSRNFQSKTYRSAQYTQSLSQETLESHPSYQERLDSMQRVENYYLWEDLKPFEWSLLKTLSPELDSLTLFQSQKSRLKNQRFYSFLKSSYDQRSFSIVDSYYSQFFPKDDASIPQVLSTLKKLPSGPFVKDQLEKILAFYPNSNFKSQMLMSQAQVYQDLREWNQALRSLEEICKLHPKSSEVAKAEFLIGYIYYENLRRDPLAEESFENMLKNHPKSELADDAEALLKDLKSGRTYLKEMMKNLGSPNK